MQGSTCAIRSGGVCTPLRKASFRQCGRPVVRACGIDGLYAFSTKDILLDRFVGQVTYTESVTTAGDLCKNLHLC